MKFNGNKQLEELALEYFLQTPVGDKLEQVLKVFDKIQNNIIALYNKKDDTAMTALKGATVLTFTLLEKLSEGKEINDINPAEWKEIANKVSVNAIMQDEQSYTIYVFSQYENYIRNYALNLKDYGENDKADAIINLADEIVEKTKLLNEELITEVAYIEDCMWISLEGMIKLIASVTSVLGKNSLEDLSWAVSVFAFEFGRCALYTRELELVNQFIDSQHIMDDELHKKYELFIKDLSDQLNLFCGMIDNAFIPNFREAFVNSVKLANTIGVKVDEILKSEDEIDSFFLD